MQTCEYSHALNADRTNARPSQHDRLNRLSYLHATFPTTAGVANSAARRTGHSKFVFCSGSSATTACLCEMCLEKAGAPNHETWPSRNTSHIRSSGVLLSAVDPDAPKPRRLRRKPQRPGRLQDNAPRGGNSAGALQAHDAFATTSGNSTQRYQDTPEQPEGHGALRVYACGLNDCTFRHEHMDVKTHTRRDPMQGIPCKIIMQQEASLWWVKPRSKLTLWPHTRCHFDLSPKSLLSHFRCYNLPYDTTDPQFLNTTHLQTSSVIPQP